MPCVWRRTWQTTPVFLPGESPWTEDSGGLQSMGSQRLGHDWATKHTCHILKLKNFSWPQEEIPYLWALTHESTLHMRWPNYWSFSFSMSPSKEILGLISFRMDWLDLLAVQGTLKSPPTSQFKSINSSVLSFLHSPTLTSIHDQWKWPWLDRSLLTK